METAGTGGRSTSTPALLAGGNPQIAKAGGDALVVRKAVKWNSPFYGIEGQG